MSGAICGVSLGSWGEIQPAHKLQFTDEEGEPTKAPKSLRCEMPTHAKKKWRYPLGEMYYQKWTLTPEEFNAAIENYDMFSLEVPPRVICQTCANSIIGGEKK